MPMIGINIILLLYAIMLAVIFIVLASVVEKVNDLIVKIKNVKDEINSSNNLTDELLSRKADRSELRKETEISAIDRLNIKNDIGKLGNRVHKLERKDS